MIKRTIVFEPIGHTYVDEDMNPYTSVTTLIGNYHPKFNEAYWAEQKAKELNVSVQTVLNQWKDTREYAQNRGNKEHNLLEDSINLATGKNDFVFDALNLNKPKLFGRYLIISLTNANLDLLKNSPLAKKYPSIYEYLEEKILDGWSLHAEKRIYWYDYLVAGTIDCLLIKGKNFIIVDWKTNKDVLKFKSGYYKKVGGIKTDIWVDKKETFFTPISSLEHCKGNIYTVQLSLYAYLLELWGFHCMGLELFHIIDVTGKTKPTVYKLTYLDWAVKLILNHHKMRLKSLASIKSSNNSLDF